MAANPSPTKLLDGVRVLDFTQYLAGPSCTRLLTELGAEVIKVELLPDGDPIRALQPRSGGLSGLFMQQNRGKRSLCIDLRHPDGLAVIHRLVPTVDVVVENGTPGVMARRGLDYESLAKVNPRLIMASVSGFGQQGMLADRSCFDFIAQGMAGLMHMTGEPDGPPYFVGIGLGDTNAGVHAFAGIGYALYQRDRTGNGCHLDVSMVDALFHMHENAVNAASITGGEFVPLRQGRHYQPVAPAGTFKGPQGWIVLLCMPNQIDGLWAAMGRPELGRDERFATLEARNANRATLSEMIQTWMGGFASDDEILAVLAEHRVPSGPVLSPAEAINHPWFIERGAVRQVRDPEGGTFAVPGFPFSFDGERPAADLHPAALGEHTREILAFAGYDETEIDRLFTTGVVSQESG